MRTLLALCIALLFSLACSGSVESTPSGPAAVVEPAPAPPPTPAPAAAPEAPSLKQGWMVIVAGSTDPAEAEGLLSAYQADQLPAVGGYPRVVDSSTVQGLKPGFHIVVAGVFDDEATAKAVSEGFQAARPGTYVRSVQVPEVESVRCSGAEADPRCLPGQWRAIIVFDVTDGMESEDWAFFSDEVMTRAKAHGVYAAWMSDEWDHNDVVIDGKTVGTVDITPHVGELFGYVVARQGAAPIYVAHQQPDDVLAEASEYLGIDLSEEP